MEMLQEIEGKGLMQNKDQEGAGVFSDKFELFLEGYWKWSDMKRWALQKKQFSNSVHNGLERIR